MDIRQALLFHGHNVDICENNGKVSFLIEFY